MTKELPGLDDREGQVAVLAQAFAVCLIRGGEQSYPVPMPEVVKMAGLAYDCGLRQTADVAGEVTIDLPGWMRQGAREHAVEVPVEPDMGVPVENALVGEAPLPPKKIPKRALATVIVPE